MAELTRPSFARHVWLLWELRAAIGLNQRRHRSSAIAAYALSSAPALPLAFLGHALLRHPAIADSANWSAFSLNLLCFICACVYVAWPILSAGVDDHSELSRYAAFPISGGRLLFASSLASLFEPRSLVILSPLAGAALGYAQEWPPAWWSLALTLFALYLLLCAGWGRAGAHFVLNVLRQKRSAEIIGGFFVALIVVCAFIPPVNTAWLRHFGTQGLRALRPEVIANAAHAFGRVPPGYLGAGLALLGEDRIGAAGVRAGLLALFAALGYVVAHRLLLAFHRPAQGTGKPTAAWHGRSVFETADTLGATLFAREALDLWRNPRARLLATVPFLLAILLRLLSGRDLIVFLAGESADAWIAGTLCLYGAVVLGSTFSQNAFGYDGHGLAALFAAPLDLRAVLLAKNRLHAFAAAALATSVGLFVAIYFRTLRAVDLACALTAAAAMIPILLAAGNLLSVVFPVRFHADLKRRDRLPFAASMFGVAAAGLGALPFTVALQLAGREGPDWGTVAEIALCAALFWSLYRALLPLSLQLLERRRELVLRAVTRS